ncbi:MAG TPA: hypothetical protein VK797_22845 [Tepidisphaeraceae bacterium]|jgi:hypothetical protein|nr:hypothetical protein [Tepidisphaeraceae bacterium]
MNIRFVTLRNDEGKTYDSYSDYHKLIDLSGFPRCEMSEINHFPPDPTVYVLAPTNGNALAVAAARRVKRCRMIAWMLERPINGLAGFIPEKFDEVWISDRWLAGQFKDNPRVRYVPMGGHAGLGGERSSTFQYDATHQAYIYGRRDHIVQELQRAGIVIGNACWGKERDEQLATSRVGLCLHQDNLFLLEPLRFTLFSCWKLPLVSEFCHDFYPYDVYPLERLKEAMQNGDGETNYRRLTSELTFRSCVEAALCQP